MMKIYTIWQNDGDDLPLRVIAAESEDSIDVDSTDYDAALAGEGNRRELIIEIDPKTVAIVVGVNIFLTATVSVLDYVKDKTKWEGDNKAAALLHKSIDFLKKLVDWASANKKH